MKAYIADSGFSQKSLAVLEDAVAYAEKHLPGIRPRTRVIIVNASMKHSGDVEEPYGECQRFSKGVFLVSLSKTVSSQLNSLNYDALTVLFHELVHVQQYSSGVLRATKKQGRHYWKGRDISGLTYDKDPSEKEAWRVGARLAAGFLETYF